MRIPKSLGVDNHVLSDRQLGLMRAHLIHVLESERTPATHLFVIGGLEKYAKRVLKKSEKVTLRVCARMYLDTLERLK